MVRSWTTSAARPLARGILLAFQRGMVGSSRGAAGLTLAVRSVVETRRTQRALSTKVSPGRRPLRNDSSTVPRFRAPSFTVIMASEAMVPTFW